LLYEAARQRAVIGLRKVKDGAAAGKRGGTR
jgi:hypothetical protein